MAMDNTDKKLVNGLIYLAVLGALAYWVPWYGYQDQSANEETARGRLDEIRPRYEAHYPPIHPAHFGQISTEPLPEAPGMYLSDLKKAYQKNNSEMNELIDEKEKSSRMLFPDWTEIPANEQLNPGVYFNQMWQKKRFQLSTALNDAKVECEDPDIGFSKEKVNLVGIDENKTREFLRELFIVEKIIDLCISAKKRQESFEKSTGFKTEAFMRIISVRPQESVATGYSALVENKKYRPDEKNPNSDGFRKYKVEFGKKFIQEYPVQIELQCDVNTFMRFLHSVRAPGQFLVIRTLDMVSGNLEESKEDVSELRSFKKDTEFGRKLKLEEEHILVRMSAAGMDFFDPQKFPGGLYHKKALPKEAPRRRGREIPTTQG